VTYEYLQRTQPDKSTLLLHAGGYFFPDRLAEKLGTEKRIELLRRHARRVSHYMKTTGSTTYMFLCYENGTKEAIEAYQIFAEEIEDLIGMLTIQYSPYNAEEGKVFWVTNSDGIDIPVSTCKYLIWANLDLRNTGTPTRISRKINENAAASTEDGEPYLAWAMTHTWSGFYEIDTNDETAENAQFMEADTYAGVTPTKWCVQQLDPDIRVVTPEELLWKIRMAHRPEQTKKILEQ